MNDTRSSVFRGTLQVSCFKDVLLDRLQGFMQLPDDVRETGASYHFSTIPCRRQESLLFSGGGIKARARQAGQGAQHVLLKLVDRRAVTGGCREQPVQ